MTLAVLRNIIFTVKERWLKFKLSIYVLSLLATRGMAGVSDRSLRPPRAEAFSRPNAQECSTVQTRTSVLTQLRWPKDEAVA